jgi:histidine triad (HIT) family protein
MDCIFCKISEGKIPCAKIWEDERFLAFLDINPINPGHTLIIPKKHDEAVFGMDGDAYSALFSAARKLSAPLQKASGAKRIGMIVEGFLVPHAHLHLVPLNAGGELDFRRAKKAAPSELAAMAAKIRDEL